MSVILIDAGLAKSHVSAYTRSDGVFVAEHEDSRHAAQDQSDKARPPTRDEINARIAAKQAEIAASAARGRQKIKDGFADRNASVPKEYRAKAQVGANIESVVGDPSYVGEFFGAPAAVVVDHIKAMVADYGGSERFSIRMSKVKTLSGDGLSVVFRGASGTYIEREFSFGADGNLSVNHSLFKAASTGGGGAKSLIRGSLGAYHALGVSEINLNANIDVGGYAWARFGYLPKNWTGTSRMLKRRLAEIQAGTHKIDSVGASGRKTKVLASPIAEEHAAAILKLLSSKDERSFWSIADMRIGDRAIGKEMLLGTKWLGRLNLGDKAAMDRCRHYVLGE